MNFAAARRGALARVMRFDAPADVLLRRYFREHPAIGRRDRARIAASVFDVLRRLRLYESLGQADSPAQAGSPDRIASPERIASSTQAGPSVDSLLAASDAFSAEANGSRFDISGLPFAIRHSLPDWLADALLAQYGQTAEELAASLLEPAPLDLRVNASMADLATVQAALAAGGIESQPLAQAPHALRVQGHPSLERSDAWLAGQFEVQDVGSQLLAMLVAARRGQTVIDLCAGAGGKTLALAAAMRSTGRLYACDVSAARLQRMRERLARARVDNVHAIVLDSERDSRLQRLHDRADAVLIDAPCTGTGTLRRNPDLKWRIVPGEVDSLVARQRALLQAAAPLVRRGGCLVYATCSLLHAENDAQLEWFESRFRGWTRRDPAEVLAGQGARLDPRATADARLRLLPHRDGSDGFFAVRWQRAS